MCDRAGFFWEKSPSGKNDQKWSKTPKDVVFELFRKITSFSFVWNLLKMKVLMVHQHSAKTACLGKIWFSSYSRKWLSANEISVFLNCQYFTNRLISDFDFWHVDRHEWKKQGSLTGFLKKFSFGEMGYFGPKNCASS